MSTLDMVNQMGSFYECLGKLVEVEEMCIRALRGKDDVHGHNYPSTLDVVREMASLYAGL